MGPEASSDKTGHCFSKGQNSKVAVRPGSTWEVLQALFCFVVCPLICRNVLTKEKSGSKDELDLCCDTHTHIKDSHRNTL